MAKIVRQEPAERGAASDETLPVAGKVKTFGAGDLVGAQQINRRRLFALWAIQRKYPEMDRCTEPADAGK